MTCGSSCNPASNFPSPSNRINGGPVPVNSNSAMRREPRRSRFYSDRLARVTDIIQQPTTISFREFAVLVLAVFALYRGYFAGDLVYTLLARTDVGQVCRGVTPMLCLRFHLWQLFWIAGGWAGEVGTWLLAGAVAVFFVEEVFAKVRSQLK